MGIIILVKKKIDPAFKLRLLRYAVMGMLIFCGAGGIALHLLVLLGATKFEIDPILTGIGSAIAYPVFCLGTMLAFYLVSYTDGIIVPFPSNKKAETLQFYVAIGSALIGGVILIVSANADNRLMIGGFAWMLFYAPGLIFRFATMFKKLLQDTKMLVIYSAVFILFVIVPIFIQIPQLLLGKTDYTIFGLLYIIPLFGLLTLGHKEDDINADGE